MSPQPLIALLCIAVAALSAAAASLLTTRGIMRKTSYMLDAIEDGETNFRFDEKKRSRRAINSTLNRLRGIFEKEKAQIMEQDAYLAKMMENISTAIVVIAQDGSVKYYNERFLTILGIRSLNSLNQLSAIHPEIEAALRTACAGKEARAVFDNELGKNVYAVSRARATLSGSEVNILSINDISKEMDENEQKSWEKLIRILTHEIMNTVSPIAALSEAMVDGEPDPIRREGLQTISASSKEMVKFVQTYRNLTGLAQPVRKSFLLKDLVERVFRLTEEACRDAGTQCSYCEKAEDILIYGDEGQISQIFINLLKNALQAGARHIRVEADMDSRDRICILFSNDGSPIPESSQANIFVPFFTTKEDGSGIGLSLSRQIMRMHSGSLSLRSSDGSGTVFSIIFR